MVQCALWYEKYGRHLYTDCTLPQFASCYHGDNTHQCWTDCNRYNVLAGGYFEVSTIFSKGTPIWDLADILRTDIK